MQVFYRGAFREELRIGQDFEVDASIVGMQDALNGLRGADWEGRLFDDNFGSVGISGDLASYSFDKTEVRCTTRADAEGLGRRVDAYENNVGLLDALRDIGGEEEIFTTAAFYNLL